MWKLEPSFVTFITPSMGRPSLENAIKSLLDLNGWNWKSIIIFDGVKPIDIKCVDYLNDNHFTVIITEKKGSAGLVRNEALDLVNTTWTAFLDDDDYLKETYLDKLKEYSNQYPEKDIFIFTYKDISNGNIKPNPGSTVIERCKVGISFAVKTEFIREHNIRFQRNGIEDFDFLDKCVKNGATYLITNDIQYYVSKRGVWS